MFVLENDCASPSAPSPNSPGVIALPIPALSKEKPESSYFHAICTYTTTTTTTTTNTANNNNHNIILGCRPQTGNQNNLPRTLDG